MRCPPAFERELLKPRYWLSWLAVGLLFLISLLPTSARHALGRFLGQQAYKRNAKRRAIALANLRYCFPQKSAPELNEIVLENFRLSATAFVEYSVLIFARKKRLDKMIDYSALTVYYDDLKAQGTNVLFLLAHSTLLDFTGSGFKQYNAGTMYKPFPNKLLNWLICYQRCRCAKFLLSRTDSLTELVRHVRNGNPFVYLADEDLGIKYAKFADFFAASKATLTTPVRICRMAHAVAVPIMTIWDKKSGKYRITFTPALENFPTKDDAHNARALNAALEQLIVPYLSQYMWTMRLFATRAPGEDSIYEK